ncbi:DUF7385 family protein [Halosegnis marinus]|uniref:Small CPxCG-related zinc finger protein n=1 Tax=Halosegnis marinus TaxID=3034023 RepID=A0ABD5ZKE5_9EURY|nr:hypothetical protein [Halosegnis sp. DT85]
MDSAEYDELVSSLTPTESGGGVSSYRNTVSVACPACGEPFDDLVVVHDEETSLELSRLLDLCVSRHDDDTLLFTHRH